MILDTPAGFNSGYYSLFLGGVLLVYTIITYIKSQANRKALEREISKEYDERDVLIDGKVAHFTLNIILFEILMMMFLSNFFEIATNTTLFFILVSFMISEIVARKYYNHVL